MQTAAEAQPNVLVVPGPEATQDDVAMNVDVDAPERGKKRGAEEEPPSDGHKKARFGSLISRSHVRARADGKRVEQKPPPLKRFVHPAGLM